MTNIADQPQATPCGGQTPAQTPFEARTQEVFVALLWALSMPGELQTLPDGEEPFALIGETLLDLETRFFTPDERLRTHLAQTGAHAVTPEEADYLFFPHWDEEALRCLARAKRGDVLYPDRAATLIVRAAFREPTLSFSGPGVNGSRAVPHCLPDAFWTLRQQALHYPLGWDAFLVSERQVMGLPRTTTVHNAEVEVN